MPKYCNLCHSKIYYGRGGYQSEICKVCGLETCKYCASGGLCKIHHEMLGETEKKKCRIISGSMGALPVILVIPFIVISLMYFWFPILDFIMENAPFYITIIIVFIFLFGIFGFPVWFLFTIFGNIRYYWIRHIWTKATGIDLKTITIVSDKIKRSDLSSSKKRHSKKKSSKHSIRRFCPACGEDMKYDEDRCGNCGFIFSTKTLSIQEVKSEIKTNTKSSVRALLKNPQFMIAVSILIFGSILAIMFFPEFYGLPGTSSNRYLGDLGFALAAFSILIVFISCCSTESSSIPIQSKKDRALVEKEFVQGFKRFVIKGDSDIIEKPYQQLSRLKEYTSRFWEKLKEEGLTFEIHNPNFESFVRNVGITLLEDPTTESQKELARFIDVSKAVLRIQRRHRSKVITYSLMVLLYGISIVIGIVMINEPLAMAITAITFILFFITFAFLQKSAKYAILAKSVLGIPLSQS